ncbi:hypothetical protein CVT24_004707 [Panaeolus cyanescens]|uniref:Peptidase A1 domain-containing protein n=1 Tax=Panaeolus cyanescens TaxID=181874 RepID=A0A409YSP5_9AGAR|nr:hypothetical protein CVT24_004707 [Panaeolus cyanescens]
MSPLLLLFICSAPISSFGSVVTLYGVSPTYAEPTNTLDLPPLTFHRDLREKFSAINPSPGSDVTTYVVEDVESNGYWVDIRSTATYTAYATPFTSTYTLVQGASTMSAHFDSGTNHVETRLPEGLRAILAAEETLNCTFNVEKNEGDCVDVDILPYRVPETTVTATDSYTGVLVPIDIHGAQDYHILTDSVKLLTKYEPRDVVEN